MAKRRSHRLRAVVWTLVALTALLVGTYVSLTRPARLRAQVLAALRSLSVEADVGDVTFAPWEGLQISNLALTSGAASSGPRDAPWLRISSAVIRCAPLHLLRGELRPTAVELHDVALVLESHRAATAEVSDETAEAGQRLLERLLTALPLPLPAVTLWQGDVQLLAVERGRSQLVQRLLVKATGQSTGDGYYLRVDRRPTGARPLAELRWNRETREISAKLDSADLRTAARLLPPTAADVLRQFDLRGQAALERLVFRLDARTERAGEPGVTEGAGPWLAAAELRLAAGRVALPVEESAAGQGAPPPDVFLRFTDVDATLGYQRDQPGGPGTVTLDASGRLRGAPTRLHARLTLAGTAACPTAASTEACPTAARTPPWVHLWPLPDRPGPDGGALSPADIHEAQLSIEGLELPTLESFPAFVRSRRLGGPLAAAFEHYRPRGRVNVRLTLPPPTDPAATDIGERIAGEIEAAGAACRYYLFPYECVDMTGRVRLAQGRIHLENLSGVHGGARLWANGVVNSTRWWSGFDLTFHGNNVALDADLYAALPEEYRRLWQRAAPLGVCDVVTTVRRADGSAEKGTPPTDVHVDARLVAGSLTLGDGDRLQQASGWLTVRGGAVQVRSLHGYRGPAELTLDGVVRAVGDTTHADLRVVVDDQPIEQHVAIGRGDGAVNLRLTAQAAVWGRIWGAERGDGMSEQLTVELKSGRLAAADPRRPWVVTGGRVHVHDARREIEFLTCRQGEAEVTAAGLVPAATEPGQPLELLLRARTPAVQELYRQFIPADWTAFLDSFGLSGAGDIVVRMVPTTDEQGVSVQAAEVDVQAAAMKPEPMPLDLRQVRARVALAPGRFRVTEATAEYGTNGRFVVRQTRDGVWRAGDVDAQFEVTAEELRLDPVLVDALPAGLGRLLTQLAGRGEFDLYLPKARVRGSQSRTWDFEGRVPLRGAALRVGLPLEVTAGELAGACTIAPDGRLELDARFTIERGQLAGRPVADWDGRLVCRADDRWVRMDDLRGRLDDGVAQGYVAIDPHSGEYELSVKLHDIGAAVLFPTPPEHADQPRRGRIDGDVWLRGRGDEVGSRRGGGSLRLRGASFLQTPVLASVARQREGRGGADHVDVAHLRFLWEGDLVRLRRIDIQSADLRLVGEGTWNLRSDAVQMILWGAHPEHWPRIAVLTDLLESAGQELVQYRVEGTLAAPKVTAEPLRRLNEALRRLLGEE